ncbi:MAG: hypothetical protein HY718_10635 [Planctomycetes bacterium]|nr:hypothetical protein [Planctomycetota bacterium]
MAFRLGEQVVRGGVDNTKKNSVNGWLELRGISHRVALNLTGGCDADLAGRHVQFRVRGWAVDEDDKPASEEAENAAIEQPGLKGFAWHQIGPTGTMTAARKVRVADCPAEELYARCLDEPPPMEWKRCLYLEELRGTQWVQGFSTCEFCDACQAEFDRE